MKKLPIRLLLLLLTLLLCLPTLAACGDKQDNGPATGNVGNNNNNQGNNGDRELTDIEKRALEKDNLPESVATDYIGRTIKTLSFQENYELDTTGSEDGNTGDIILDLVYKRNKTVEERLGIEIENVKSGENTWSDYATKLNQLANSQDTTYDIIYTMGNSAKGSGAEQLLFKDVTTLPMLSLDSPWWKLDAMESVSFDEKKIFFLIGDIAVTTYNKAAAIFVNSDLFNARNEMGLDGLYDMVIAGNWTIEQLGTFAKEYGVDADGGGLTIGSNDVIGFAIGNLVRVRAMENGFDVKRWTRDNDGCVMIDYDLTRASDAVDALIGLLYENEGVYYTPNSYLSSADFPKGNIIFTENQLGLLRNLKEMEANFGVLPTPKLDSTQKEYTTVIQESATYTTISNFSQDTTFASVVVEALCAESYRRVTLPYLENCMKIQYVRESRVGQIIDIIQKAARCDFLSLYMMEGLGTLIADTTKLEANLISSSFTKKKEAAEEWILNYKTRYYPQYFPTTTA